jgi:hypothetical protein
MHRRAYTSLTAPKKHEPDQFEVSETYSSTFGAGWPICSRAELTVNSLKPCSGGMACIAGFAGTMGGRRGWLSVGGVADWVAAGGANVCGASSRCAESSGTITA